MKQFRYTKIKNLEKTILPKNNTIQTPLSELQKWSKPSTSKANLLLDDQKSKSSRIEILKSNQEHRRLNWSTQYTDNDSAGNI